MRSQSNQLSAQNQGNFSLLHPQRPSRPGKRALQLAFGITTAFFAVEGIGGLLTHSLALLADAGHMLTDLASLALALLAMKFAMRPATSEKTYGYYRTEILAALVNGVTLVVIALYIFYEAFQRFQSPPEVKSLPMLTVAALGLIANLASAYVLLGSKGQSLNVRGAFLHVVSDVLGSLGAITAGLMMLATRWYLADPLISIFIGLLILFSSWRLLRESVNVLMEGVPAHIDLKALETAMRKVPGVSHVHDLHVWTVTSGFEALSAHVVVEEGLTMERAQRILHELHAVAHQGFGIQHTTIQLEEERLVQVRVPDSGLKI